jgi:hypothetical protein
MELTNVFSTPPLINVFSLSDDAGAQLSSEGIRNVFSTPPLINVFSLSDDAGAQLSSEWIRT